MLAEYKGVLYSKLFTNAPVIIFIWKNKSYWPVEAVTNNIERILGYSEKDFLDSKVSFHSLIHPNDFQLIYNEVEDFLNSKKDFLEHSAYRLKKADGSYLWVKDCTIKVVCDNKTSHLIGYLFDISKENFLQQKMQEYLNIVNENVIISSTDLDGKITFVSKAFCEVCGYTKNELLGENHNIIRHPDMKVSFFKELWKCIKAKKTWKGEIKNLSKDKKSYWVQTTISPIYDEEKNHIGYTSVRQNITDKKLVEELSITDALTGIYNRLKIDKVLSYEIEQSIRYDTKLSVILVDVDNFKMVNDTFGHQAGDSVLKEIALVLNGACRKSDSVGRWGGEEFLIVLPKTDIKRAKEVAIKLQKEIEAFEFSHVVSKTCSFGVSTFEKSDNEAKLVEKADEALYEAKREGKNRVKIRL
jgi:diguanylate cyclase (GGDEF)-like protein/PAS domain S-box-containing protein